MNLQRSCRLVLVAAVACVAACSSSTPPDAPDSAPAATEVRSDTAALPAPDTAATLVAYHWQLASATDASGQSIAAFFPTPDRPLGIEFAVGRLGVTGSCNRLSAGYQLPAPTQLQLGQSTSTMMACPPPLAEADAAFGRFLQGNLQVAIEQQDGAPRLLLTSADGSSLAFDGSPTPETRFGGPGTRAFLEVSPQPCAGQDAATGRCLTVRDRHFDDNGLATGTPGEWRSLPQGIEGYTPVQGEQQVVRVKRFESVEAAGGAPVEHFVLDLVVESRVVQ
jgi:heat shock protein HslJ